MTIVLTGAHKGGDHTLPHDLNFQSEKYEATHTVTFRNPKPDLAALLEASGGDANGVRGPKGDAAKSGKKRRDKAVDMEKLADGLQKLNEDDLLQVVTMVHDNKTNETYTKNDVESMFSLLLSLRAIANKTTQTASSTSTSTRSPTPSSRCSGTSPRRRPTCRLGRHTSTQMPVAQMLPAICPYVPILSPRSRRRATSDESFDMVKAAFTLVYHLLAKPSLASQLIATCLESRLPYLASYHLD